LANESISLILWVQANILCLTSKVVNTKIEEDPRKTSGKKMKKRGKIKQRKNKIQK